MLGKLLVLGATIVGVISFFLPTLTVEIKKVVPSPEVEVGAAVVDSVGLADVQSSAESVRISFSAFKALSGVKSLHDAVPETSRSGDYWEDLGSVVGYVALPWAPTALFLLFTLIGIRRFGRGLGALSLLVGLGTIGAWVVINTVLQKHAASAGGLATLHTETGFTLLLVGAIAGAAGGALALVAPQRKKA